MQAMSPCEPEMREKACRLCRDFLSGAWRKVSCDDLVVKRFSGGLSNLLYFCALPKSVAPVGAEPRQVLLRIYGQVHDDAVEAVITQSVIFTLLSERCLGPKLYGVFPGGRIEEYIPARPLLTTELSNPKISSTIAEKLACVHGLRVPINKEPSYLSDTMTRWLQFIRNRVTSGSVSADDRPKMRKLLSHSFEKEYDWIMKMIPKASSPVIFSHNDLQEGNILVKENAKDDKELIFIDYEYCSYNYRGFDFANHFCEWCYDYTNTELPNFTCYSERFPTRDQQLHFIRTYLRNFPSPRDCHQNGSGIAIEKQLEEAILKEVLFFVPISHFFWSLWAIVNGCNAQIPFGYLDYALSRLDAYFVHKGKLVADIGGKRKATSPVD